MIFGLHLLLCIAIFYLVQKQRRFPWPWDLQVSAFLIIFWASLIFSAGFLSIFNLYGHDLAYVATSGLGFIGMVWLLTPKDIRLETPTLGILSGLRSLTASQKPAAMATLLFAGICLFMTARTTLQIPDTLAMKLPNSFFYVQNGNLLPAWTSTDDTRLFSTPFNGTILWAHIVRFDLHVRSLVLVNYLCWIAIFLSTFRISRTLGASFWSSFSASAFFCLTQNLLFQATSDNDDLISSVTATMGAAFFFIWLKNRDLKYLLVGALGVGISLGAKFFPALYLPAALMCFSYFAIQGWRQHRKEFVSRFLHLALAGAMAGTLVLPYVISRALNSDGNGVTAELLSQSENKPFRAAVAVHNLVVYNLQLFTSPISDAFFPRSSGQRDKIVNDLNSFWLSTVVPNVDKVWAYMPGVKIVHPLLYDNTVWFGIFGWMCGFALLVVLLKREYRFGPYFWLSVFFFSWNIFFCVRTRYIEELGRYWILPLSLTVPLVALLIDKYLTGTNRLSKASIAVVWLITINCAWVGLYHNQVRISLKTLIEKRAKPPLMSNDLRSVTASCDQVTVLNKIYGYPMFLHMKDFKGDDFQYKREISNAGITIIPGLDLPVFADFYENKFIPVPLSTNLGGIKFYGESGLGIPMYVNEDPDCSCTSTCSSKPSVVLGQISTPLPPTGPTATAQVKILKGTAKGKFRYRVVQIQNSTETILKDWTEEETFSVSFATDADRIGLAAKDELGNVFFGSLGTRIK